MRIIIVGAGPSGSSAAYFLAKQNHEVLIIDPKAPCEKTCGGGVPSKCLKYFPEFYQDFELSKILLDSMVFSFENEDFCEIPMPGGMGIFSREKHDQHIFEKALSVGASHRALTFKDCFQEGGSWKVKTDEETLECDFLIGADGATSRVRNRLAKKLPRESYFKAADYLVSKSDLPLHIGFDKNLNGYLWVFPRKENCSIGIVDFDDDSVKRKKFLENYFKRFGVEESEIIKKRSALIPSLRSKDLKQHQVAGEKWALVGDAAALAEPITGEGIYYAMRSGKFLSECIQQSKDYNKLWKKEFKQIVTEAKVSRASYRLLNNNFMKFFLRRSALMRKMTGDYLAAFENGNTQRLKFFASLPLIAIQATFSKAVTCK